MAVVIDRRADVGSFRLPPEAVRFGHVAAAAEANGQRSVAAADREHHAARGDNAGTDITVNAIGVP
jgi:hypothetical protein